MKSRWEILWFDMRFKLCFIFDDIIWNLYCVWNLMFDDLIWNLNRVWNLIIWYEFWIEFKFWSFDMRFKMSLRFDHLIWYLSLILRLDWSDMCFKLSLDDLMWDVSLRFDDLIWKLSLRLYDLIWDLSLRFYDLSWGFASPLLSVDSIPTLLRSNQSSWSNNMEHK